jgi:adenosylhomocysteine nucleosidase
MKPPSALLALAALALTSCVSPPEGAPTAQHAGLPYGPKAFSERSYTALVVAYSPELQGMLETIEALPDAAIETSHSFKGITYRMGQYQGKPIILFESGMSIANAAMSLQMAIDYFPIEQVIYMGIAGAVDPELQPGDVVIPERWYYHDESVYSNPRPDAADAFILPDYYTAFLSRQEKRRAQDPHLPRYRNFGMIHPDEVLIIKEGMDEPESTAYFSASPRLLAAAREALTDFDRAAFRPDRELQMRVGGNGVTGSVFVDNREYRKWLREVYQADVTEMESAAVGQVCAINQIDWIVIRAVSDLAGGQEGKNEENIYDLDASRVGAAVLFALLDVLAEAPATAGN